MKKKHFPALLLAAALVLSLTACGGTPENTSGTAVSSSAETASGNTGGSSVHEADSSDENTAGKTPDGNAAPGISADNAVSGSPAGSASSDNSAGSAGYSSSGASSGSASSDSSAAPKKEVPLTGEYAMFAIESGGYLVSSEAMDMEALLTLKEDGMGSLTMNGESRAIVSWDADDDPNSKTGSGPAAGSESGSTSVTLTMEDETTASAFVQRGVLALSMPGSGDYILYFAQPGADISAYTPLSYDELMEAYAQKAASASSSSEAAGPDEETPNSEDSSGSSSS